MPGTSTSQQEFLNKLSELMEANLGNESFGVSELARELGMSRSNLHRKVNSILNISASQYIREFRLEKAKELLQETSLTVSEITYKVGFGSTSYFIKCFREHFGYTPGESENHNGTNEPSATSKQWFRPVKLDKSDFIVWSLVFIVLLNIFFIVIWPKIKSSEKLEKTIAVLPFRNNSPDSTNAYINGIMEAVLNNLVSIDELDVRSRTSVEQYRESNKSLSEIAKELGVNYIVEGSGQKNGNEILLTINLLDAKSDKSISSENYRREINEVNDYFDLQGDIAVNVSSAIQARLTPQEKVKIEKRPTENLAAYNLYLQGQEFQNLARNNALHGRVDVFSLVLQAKRFFEEAIKADSTFAFAYLQLGHIYINNLSSQWDIDLSESYIDSGFVMVQKALQYDKEIGLAFGLMANYYLHKGMFDEALKEWKKVDELSKDGLEWQRNVILLWRYMALGNHYETLKNFYLFKQRKPETRKITISTLSHVCNNWIALGYPKIAQMVSKEMLNLSNDSIIYYAWLYKSEINSGNFETSLRHIMKANQITDFNRDGLLYFRCINYFYLKDFKKAFDNYNLSVKKAIENYNVSAEEAGEIRIVHYDQVEPGYLLQLYDQQKANIYYQKLIQENLKEIKYNRPAAQSYDAHFCLACIYSALGQKEKAIDYLVQLKNRNINDVWLLTRLKHNPMLDNIRNEPEFAEVVKDVETKYQKEHERVGELLRKYGELQ